ncbi:hypothetical protein L3X38_016117 [Prunus dulcis]|uniref:Uncharacterized protein n=1 Tax=Prunus dulcis TaxID=3755 RepID=A0AAD4Z9H9_PRUDU|nr:hypothetical protein L3X38_016117 [Prunus dulcis]
MDVMAGLRWKDSCCGLSSEKSGLSHIFEVRIEANVIHTRVWTSLVQPDLIFRTLQSSGRGIETDFNDGKGCGVLPFPNEVLDEVKVGVAFHFLNPKPVEVREPSRQ